MNELKAGTPYVTPDLAIVPVDRTWCGYHQTGRRFNTWGFKEPVAVVILTRLETKAMDIAGMTLDLDQLLRQTPGLPECLDRLKR